MKLKSILLAGSAVIALSGAPLGMAYAADTTTDTTVKSDTGVAASKAGTEIEKAVGAGDTLTAAELASAVKLSTVTDPAKTLAAAKVDDMHGNIIGPVKSVVQENNKAVAINVDAGGWLGMGEHVVSISASKFKYIASRDILVTSATKAQVKAMKTVEAP